MFKNPVSNVRPNTASGTLAAVLASVLIFCGTLARFAHAEMLNGIASYEQLSREYYIVALYTEQPIQDVDTALSVPGPMRAELRIVVKEWAPRSFSQIWMRDLSMNNDLSESAEQIQSLLAFANFPKAPLVTGDRLEFDYAPGTGTRIRFNGQVVTQGEGPVLFRYALKTWIGSSPPTRQFREDMLAGGVAGKASMEKLLARQNGLTIAAGREGLLKTWQADANRVAQEAEAARQREAKAAEEAARLKAEEEARQLAAQKEIEEKAARAIAARAAAEAQAAAAAKAAEAAREQARLQAEKAAQAAERARTDVASEAARLAEAEQKAAEEAQKRQAEEEAKARLAAEAAAAEAAAQAQAQAQAEAEARALEAQRTARQEAEYAQGVYRWQVQQAVSRAVTYPEWARLFGEQGSYQASFQLDSQGRVTAITRMEPDGTQLADEFRAAIERASPFGPLPAGLDEKTSFSVNHQFALQGEAAPLPPKPAMPAALLAKRQASLTDADRAALIERYTQSVQTRVTQTVVYPLWAKNQKKTGDVTVEVKVTADGRVASVDVVESARLKQLNDAVIDAAQKAAPFEPIPEELGLSELKVRVAHRFELR